MSSPRAPRSPQTPRRAGSRTPSSRLSTPRRRVAGTSERDVIPASEGNVTPRRSQASEGNVTPRRSQASEGNVTPRRSPRRSQASDGNVTPRRSQQAPSSPFHNGISEIDLSSPMNYGTPSSVGSTRSARSGGIRGTPVRSRLDVRQERRARSMSVIAENENEGIIPSQSSEADDGPEFQIWGTEVVVSKCKRKFRRFILEFVENMPAEDEISEGVDNNLPIYLQKLEEIKILEQPFLNLNCAHLEEFDPDFYSQLVRYPQDVIPTLDMAVNEIFFERYPAAVLEHQIQIRPFNSHRTKNMRALNPEDIDQLITIQGMVIRTSNLIPEIRVAFFRCIVCNFETTVDAENGFLQEPTLCSSCSTSHCFQLIHNRSEFTDKQIVKLQEPPDDIPAGQTPHTISLMCYNDLVDTVQAGERVTVTGVYRAVPVQVNPRMSVVYSVYKTFVDVVHFRKVDSNRLRVIEDGKTTKFSDERIEAIKHLASKSDIYERLARALAPSIYENIDIKKGILLQLFSGTRKNLQSAGRGKVRSEINILLCGDPGTSKSQFLSYVYDLVPRSQYTSGKGSSAVGLTAYVMKDPETKQLVLQTGALVLADNGICCIDEFDKMNDSTRSVLHEVMEQQTLSIAKAGIICQLNARTSILAAANPCESKWNAKKTIIENILLPHSLLSRFDLIFLVLDPQDEAYDRRLAWHLVSLYHRRPEEEDQDFMDMDILRDYIAYARENVHPKIGELAKTALINDYVQMRKVGSRRGLISAYPRQLESLIRLSEAHARMRLSDIVEESDVEEAWRLYREALKQSATDPLSGRVDVTILTTGQSESYRIQVEKVMKELKTIFVKQKKVGVLSYQTLFKEVKEKNAVMDYPMFDKCLKNLEDERLISCMHKKSVRILQ